jgi:RNA binding exosome subunit
MIPNENGDFSSAEIRIIVHATEEKDKILEHLNRMLSVPPHSFSTIVTEGHWGNKILLLTGILSKNEANSLYMKVRTYLNKNYSELSNFIDEKGNLYIRLDKQRICRGKVSLSDGDSVRIKFRPVLKYEFRKSLVE